MWTLMEPYVVIGAVCAASGLFVALWLSRPERARRPGSSFRRNATFDKERVAFLFQDGLLVDATANADRLLGPNAHFEDLVEVMGQRFPGIAAVTEHTDSLRQLPSVLPGDDAFLSVERRGAHLSVTLHDALADASDRHLWLSGEQARNQLSDIIDHAPVVIWSFDKNGRLAHTNDAFRRVAQISGDDMPFDLPDDETSGLRRRLWIEECQTAARHWFDLSSHDLPDGTQVHYAADADATVTAEIAQRNFVQTLTKTFAQLSIGLAIFDRHRQLALFNPALIDLTSLPADFLSARPTLMAFFDQLRDRQIMPEPRNYRTWRDQLSDMIDAARDGAYCETWTLPTGLTYRISGKPHPDGAVAFLFEDISAEITLTRRFRAELERSQAVMDAIDTAIAVFSRSGVLTFANQGFRDLWKCSPDESFIELTIVDISKIWQENCAPTPVWGDLRDFVGSVDERTDWQDTVVHKTRGPLSVLAAPVTGGATLVRFAEQVSVASPPSPVRSAS